MDGPGVTASERLTVYRFGGITLDPARRRVRRGNEDIRLGKLTYQLLLLLVEAAPRIVTQEDVVERLWGDRVATQDTIRQRVKLLRKGLGDDPDNPRYFRVLRGQGYRLIPDVERSDAEVRSSGKSRAPLRAAAIAFAIAAAVTTSYWTAPGPRETTDDSGLSIPAETAARSIAVLPFENLTNDPEDAYFVDGFHNDLLTQLAKINRFKVISRTSVLGYRDEERNLREIGDELDVETILEGSVQRSGDLVRINAQLIDAESDEHLWAERYDRELSAQNLFQIQSEMATAIAGALQAALSPEELVHLSETPTDNIGAYNEYLIGNQHIRDSNNFVSFARAAESFQRAVQEDPDFAVAWAALSRAHSAVYFFNDRTEDRNRLARSAVERAFELKPDLPEAHLAMGYYHYHVNSDHESALREWAIAERGLPGDTRILQARSYVYARMGEWEQSILNAEQALVLDPRNVELMTGQAVSFARFKNYDRALSVSERIRKVAPDEGFGHVFSAMVPLWRDGDVAPLAELLDAIPLLRNSARTRWEAAIFQRDYEAALEAVDTFRTDAIVTLNSYWPKTWYAGVAYKLAGDVEMAAEQMTKALTDVESRLDKDPDGLRFVVTLASVYGYLGETTKAVAMVERASELLESWNDAAAEPRIQLELVRALLAAGDNDAAIKRLDLYLSLPGVWSIEGLLSDPRLDPIRGDQRFAAVVGEFSRNLQ